MPDPTGIDIRNRTSYGSTGAWNDLYGVADGLEFWDRQLEFGIDNTKELPREYYGDSESITNGVGRGSNLLRT